MSEDNNPSQKWTATHAYAFAVVCLLIGVVIGYLVRGTAPTAPQASTAAAAPAASAPVDMSQQPTPDQMRRMADKQAEPLFAKLKQNPNDAAVLAQIAAIYYQTQNFPEAIGYYEKSLALKEDPEVRTNLGGVYYYERDADKAIAEFERALKSDPKNADALFNLGVARWQGKNDGDGAIAAWQQLLKDHPDHPRRRDVEQLIALVKKHKTMDPSAKAPNPGI